MSDRVVTVPMKAWSAWLEEGDLPGDSWTGMESHFRVGLLPVQLAFGDRLYIVAHGRLRGYAPITGWEAECAMSSRGRPCLIRKGRAKAVTIAERIRGFQGIRRRWWDREEEHPFPTYWRP